jgi:hypothetical protein
LKILYGRGHLAYLGVDGKVVLKWTLKKYGARYGAMNWIHLAQDKVKRCAVVNMVMNFRVP